MKKCNEGEGEILIVIVKNKLQKLTDFLFKPILAYSRSIKETAQNYNVAREK